MIAMYIHLYTGEVTANAQDGAALSEDGSGTLPLYAKLDASLSESEIIKCALRCDEGHKTYGNTVISFVGKTAAKWQVAVDDNFADTLTIAEEITSGNIIFWIKATSTADEKPAQDTNVKIAVKCQIVPDKRGG